jgi:hypothetical protein
LIAIGIFGFTSSAASTSRCWNSCQIVGRNAQYDRANGGHSRRKGKSSRFDEGIIDGCAVEKAAVVLLLKKFDPALSVFVRFVDFLEAAVKTIFVRSENPIRIDIFVLKMTKGNR